LLTIGVGLLGCGPVALGEEPPLRQRDGELATPDGAAAPHEDAGASPEGGLSTSGAGLDSSTLRSVVSVSAVGCEGCFELRGEAEGGRSPYRFRWEDGSEGGRRRVCPPANGKGRTVELVVIDADGVLSSPQATRLEFPEADCDPPPSPLCLLNPSFEGTPQFNDGGKDKFDAIGWSQCTNPDETNTPEIGNNSISQPVADVPDTTDGETFLGLAEGEQVSQTLCEPLESGSERFVRIDLQRIYLGVPPDTEFPFLEIWGGVAADCSQRELLWVSEPVKDDWGTYCATLRPHGYTNLLTLRAGADGSNPTASYMAADNMVPVESCP